MRKELSLLLKAWMDAGGCCQYFCINRPADVLICLNTPFSPEGICRPIHFYLRDNLPDATVAEYKEFYENIDLARIYSMAVLRLI